MWLSQLENINSSSMEGKGFLLISQEINSVQDFGILLCWIDCCLHSETLWVQVGGDPGNFSDSYTLRGLL